MNNPGQDEALWRNRFLLLNLARFAGTLAAILGIAIWFGDFVVEGGSLALGLPLTLIGMAASFWGPKALSRRWRRRPPEE